MDVALAELNRMERSMQEIAPGVWLGSAQSARDQRALRAAGVTHVLQVARELAPVRHEGVEVMVIDADDSDGFPLLRHFGSACAFIRRAVASGGSVLVHCSAGCSRSPTVVAAYLMLARGVDDDAALAEVRRRREWVSPNDGFREQLRSWGRELAGQRERVRDLSFLAFYYAATAVPRL
eukprot:m51a1_g5470 putative dual specificity (179) ;mRNA; f:281244-281983